jgi:secreted PhoX family phosphatase
MVTSSVDALQHCRWSCGFECFHEAPNRSEARTFQDVLQEAVSRRAVMKAGAGAAAAGLMLLARGPAAVAEAVSSPIRPGRSGLEVQAAGRLRFTPIDLPVSSVDAFVVPDGYTHNVVIAWGDPLFAGTPAFDPAAQTPARQAAQFGYNADYVQFSPLPAGSGSPHRGLLWVNHEYTNPELMFPDYDPAAPTRDQVDIELLAHGGSVVELARRRDGTWTYVLGSAHNRRITALTPIELTGPAAGDPLLRTSADPTGHSVLGMLNNCAGGVTPWGTILACEENFNQYFANAAAVADERTRAWHARYGLPTGPSERRWELYHPRFDLAAEPNEAFRHGWVVEVDPYDPDATPRKRTALGRFKHEGATVTLAADSRVVVYSGDDERFDYVYKFVSDGRYRPGRHDNGQLLDAGTLSVARFNPDGTGEWLPLVHGAGPLTAANGFAGQAEVLINARGAADLLGATKMDRPEDIERNPVTGAIYAVMTNNTRRTAAQVDAANPRGPNRYGHIIEWHEAGDDAAATTFRWDIFMLCGPAGDASRYFAGFDPSLVSDIATPDNVLFDQAGNLWIVTDGQPGTIGRNDAMFAVPVAGAERGHVRPFLAVPSGAECTGPAFTPNEQTVFIAVQHPGEGGTFAAPLSRWPDFAADRPPRPGITATWRAAPGDPRIGS